jgi:hypothetical protein
MLTLKAIKIAKFMSEETLAYTANIYWKNKKVGDCKNEGHGGNTMVWLHKASDAQEAEMQKFVMDHPKTKEWLAEFPDSAKYGWQYHLESLVDALAYEKEEIDDLKRLCKGKTCFRVKGQPEGAFYQIKAPLDAAMRDHLSKKHGDDIVEILNDTLTAKLAK